MWLFEMLSIIFFCVIKLLLTHHLCCEQFNIWCWFLILKINDICIFYPLKNIEISLLQQYDDSVSGFLKMLFINSLCVFGFIQNSLWKFLCLMCDYFLNSFKSHQKYPKVCSKVCFICVIHLRYCLNYAFNNLN